jgi:RNA polymerase sigma-70 factor, ECF subfamily
LPRLGRRAATCKARDLESTGPQRTVSPEAEREDAKLVDALRRRDERAFEELVDRYSSALLRLALDFVRTRAVAEEVVQETWLAVLNGIDRFEGRSSLKTWLFRILVNRAKTRGIREARTLPFSALEVDDEPAVPPDRFRPDDHRWAGDWATPPRSLDAVPVERLLSSEMLEHLGEALAALPESQRVVVTLRDFVGCDADEVCELVGVSDGNQRVLLHRGRSKLRAALEQYVEEA